LIAHELIDSRIDRARAGEQFALQAAEKLVEDAKSSPQALKRLHIFGGLAARLQVVPFPKPA
jgi:hypothetical protein